MDAAILYNRIRTRLDLNDSLYLSNATELGPMCEESYFELWDILIALMGDEAPWEQITVPTVPNQDHVDISVASGVYRLLRLDFAVSGTKVYQPVQSLNLAADELNANPTNWTSARSFRYFARRGARPDAATRNTGGFSAWRFSFSPPPSGVYSLRMFYVPPPPIVLSGTPDFFHVSFPDEFPEYVIADVCAKIMDKQEADSAPFVAERERIKGRIERYAKPHQMNGPKHIPDFRSLNRSAGGPEDNWRSRR